MSFFIGMKSSRVGLFFFLMCTVSHFLGFFFPDPGNFALLIFGLAAGFGLFILVGEEKSVAKPIWYRTALR